MNQHRVATEPPGRITIGPGGAALVLHRGGAELVLPARALRAACRCAGCTAAARRGAPVVAEDGIRLAAAAPIGGYALNLAFSDGHARGVFPFAYLDELAAECGA